MENKIQKLKIAFATDNGKTFMGRHFGDAEYYDIYEIGKDQATFTKRISNTANEDEEIHADPRKAGSITQLLKQEKVQVVVSKIFGPNIKRIKKNFVCIIINNKNIFETLPLLQTKIDEIITEWESGEERNFLTF